MWYRDISFVAHACDGLIRIVSECLVGVVRGRRSDPQTVQILGPTAEIISAVGPTHATLGEAEEWVFDSITKMGS